MLENADRCDVTLLRIYLDVCYVKMACRLTRLLIVVIFNNI